MNTNPTIKPTLHTELVAISPKAGEFLGRLLQARIQGHVYHLQTSSFAQHKALDEFYNEIVGLFDGIAEAYQGVTNSIVRGYNIPLLKEDNLPIPFLKGLYNYVRDNRYLFVPANVTHIQNEIDNVQTLIASTLYKLQKLS